MSSHESTHGRRHDSVGGGNTDVSAKTDGKQPPLRQRADSPHPSGHGIGYSIGSESEEVTSDVGIGGRNGHASGRPDEQQLRQMLAQVDSTTPETDFQDGMDDGMDGSTVRSKSQCAEMQSRIGRRPKDEPRSYTGCSLSEIAASRVPRSSEPKRSGDRAGTDPCVTQASGYLANIR